MSITPEYQPYYKQAQDLQFRFHDLLGNSPHPTANVMRQQINHLVDDIELNKNPRDIEGRIKTIQHQMLEAQHQNLGLMNYDHQNAITTQMEQMRRNIRGLPNY